MKLPPFEYVAPKSLTKACELLRDKKSKAIPIAGGTDLLMALKNRLKTPCRLVDLSMLPRPLHQMSYSTKRGLILGGLVSLRQAANHTAVRDKYPMLVQALLSVGSPQLQVMGTLGGNLCQDTLCVYYNRSPMLRQTLEPCHKLGGKICHAVRGSKTCWATYCGDVAPALLALQAKIKIVGPNSEKVIPLQRFYSADGKKPNVLKPGDILTEIQVPPPRPRSGGAYLKLRIRKAIDYPLLGVGLSLSLRNGEAICEEANLALTGVERAPLLIQEAETLQGKRLEDKIVEGLAEAAYRRAHPVNTVCELTPKYRKDMVRVYVMEAVHLAIQQASKGGVL